MKILYFIGLSLITVGTMVINGYGSESKYDSQVSKYDLGLQSIRYKFDENTNRCTETALKEREAIMADIKSGRFKVKLHPDYKDALFLANDFAREKEFLYFGSLGSCVKWNRNTMVQDITYRGGY